MVRAFIQFDVHIILGGTGNWEPDFGRGTWWWRGARHILSRHCVVLEGALGGRGEPNK